MMNLKSSWTLSAAKLEIKEAETKVLSFFIYIVIIYKAQWFGETLLTLVNLEFPMHN